MRNYNFREVFLVKFPGKDEFLKGIGHKILQQNHSPYFRNSLLNIKAFFSCFTLKVY